MRYFIIGFTLATIAAGVLVLADILTRPLVFWFF
jgi:hypothetical protein